MKIPDRSFSQAARVRPKAKSEAPTPSDGLSLSETSHLQIKRPSLQQKSGAFAFRFLQSAALIAGPSAGLALGGLPGLGAAVLLNGALNYLDPKNHGNGVESLLLAASSSAMAIPASLGPAGVALTGAVGLFLGARSGQRAAGEQTPTASLDPKAVAQGLSQRLGQVESQPLLSGFTQAVEQQGMPEALNLLREVGKDLVTHSDDKRLDQLVQPKVLQQEQSSEGYRILEGQDPKDPGYAFATGTSVHIDGPAFQQLGPAIKDLVVGHELSHLRHRDQAGELAVQALYSALENQPLPADNAWQVADLDRARAQQLQDIELRSDQEGVGYALQQGHSPDSLAAAAERRFPGNEEYYSDLGSHPRHGDRRNVISQEAWRIAGEGS